MAYSQLPQVVVLVVVLVVVPELVLHMWSRREKPNAVVHPLPPKRV